MGRSGTCLMEAAFCDTLIVSSDCPSGPKEFLINEKVDLFLKTIQKILD